MSDSKHFTSKLAGQRIIILGGTGGIGIAVARACIENGASVVLSSSRVSSIESAIKSIETEYPSAKPRLSGSTCDLGSADTEANLENLFKQVGGTFDHIVYMAGQRIPTIPLNEVNMDKINYVFSARAYGPILTAKVGSRYLTPGPKSSIILTTGSIAEKPIPGGWATLAYTGGGTVALTHQLAFDLAPVRVNAVAPGVTDTNLWADMPKDVLEAFMRAQKEKVLTGEVGQADDVAEAFLYLMKDKNTTGIVVHTSSGDLLI